MKPYRIVVTGSRNWTNRDAVIVALEDAVREAFGWGIKHTPHHAPHAQFPRVIVVQGGAAGADAFAAEYGTKNFPTPDDGGVETFEADWKNEGKAAGPKRNRRMLDSGAQIVLAFPIGGVATSPGTWDCIHAAAERGILIHERDVAEQALKEAREDIVGLSEVIERIEALLPQNFLMSDDAAENVRVFVEAQREAIRRSSPAEEIRRPIPEAPQTPKCSTCGGPMYKLADGSLIHTTPTAQYACRSNSGAKP